MKDLTFTWDLSKGETNKRKHGITFEEAQTVFYDEQARLIYDPDHSETEERFLLIGLSAGLRLLVVVHVYRDDEGMIRLISARKATKNEAHHYTRHLP